MKIYTYHEPDPSHPHQHSLLPLWQETWAKLGWEPVVLTRRQAFDHPLYLQLVDHFNRHLPTTNSPAYELACYLRWLAMVQVGGGWMSDADVIPWSLVPLVPETNELTVFSQGSVCPCLVHGSASEYERIARMFLNHKGGVFESYHASDQNILQLNRSQVRQVELVPEYGQPGWERSAVVHFPNNTMRGYQPRSEWIPKLRALN